MSGAFWVCASLAVISAAVSFGYSVAGLRGATGAARTASWYALVRSGALLGAAVVAVVAGSVPFVVAIALVMVLVQAGDAVVGFRLAHTVKTVGPAATAVVHAASLVWLLAV